jgi:RimJ/RimL family protein N-acetyltransferase
MVPGFSIRDGMLHLRSCRVLEKAGYQLEARLKRQAFKDGQVCDQWMYALLRTADPRGSRSASVA